jgi:hypothetical protein
MSFRIAYDVRDRANQKDPERVFAEDLDSAVVSYRPDADLRVQVGGQWTELDIGRDMYGLYEDLPRLAERIAFDEPSAGPYLESLGAGPAKSYSIRLDESYRPRIVYFLVTGDEIGVETRSLVTSDVTIDDTDVNPAVPTTRAVVLSEIVGFLERYLGDLVSELPAAAEAEDYQRYKARIDALRAAAG